MTLIIIVLIAVWLYSKYSSKNERNDRNTYSAKNSTKSVRNTGNSYSTKKSAQILKEEQEEKEDLYKKGEEYFYGLNGIHKPEVAYSHFLSAAEQGNSSAEYMVGVLLEMGVGVQKNPQEAVLWYKRAANNANTKAQYKLGKKYLYGEDIEKDIELGKTLIRKAAQNGNKSAQDFFENIESHIKSPSVRAKSQETIPKVNKPTPETMGDPQANQYFRKGLQYEQGNGVAIDIDRAMEYYRKAVVLGSISASHRLKALKAKQKSILRENETSGNDSQAYQYYKTGMQYEHGTGVQIDIGRAMDYYHKAADLGSEIAMHRLNKMKEQGYSALYDLYKKDNSNQQQNSRENETSGDDRQAYQYYRTGMQYEQGNGVAVDIGRAMDYYHKAADLGSEIAKYRLKKLNEQGFSTSYDLYKKNNSNQQHIERTVNNNVTPVVNNQQTNVTNSINNNEYQKINIKAQNSKSLFDQAVELKRKGQYESALRIYKQAYEEFPEDQDLQTTMYAMAKVYLLIGDYEKSCSLFQAGLTQKLFKFDERVGRFYKEYLFAKYSGEVAESGPEYVWFRNLTADYSIFIGLTHYLLENNGAELLSRYRNDFNNHMQSVAGKTAAAPSRGYIQMCYDYGWTRVIAIASESYNRCFDKIDLGYVQGRKQDFLDILKTI